MDSQADHHGDQEKPASRRRKRPTTRRNLEPVVDLRPVGADGSRPPALDLKLARKLKMLALANVLPFVAFTVMFFGWVFGHITFKIDEQRLLFTLLIMLACLVVVASCWLVLFPFSKWMRAYPLWFFHHESKLVWALPTIAAWVAWLFMWVACVGLTLFALYLIGAGFLDLFSRIPGES